MVYLIKYWKSSAFSACDLHTIKQKVLLVLPQDFLWEKVNPQQCWKVEISRGYSKFTENRMVILVHVGSVATRLGTISYLGPFGTYSLLAFNKSLLIIQSVEHEYLLYEYMI